MIAEEVDDEDEGKQQQKTSQQQQVQVSRSTGPVDRRAQRAQGKSSVDRPVDRLKVPNSLLGARSTGGRGRSTARSTDKRVRAAIAVFETCLYIYGISRVFM